MSRGITTLDIDELAKEFEDLKSRLDDVKEYEEADEEEREGMDEPDPLDEDEIERLQELSDLADEIGELWQVARNEPTAIAVADFPQYAEELAHDIGAINQEHGWPLNCIDWKEAAEQLAQDYTEFSFEGTDYYIRTY
jgi:DNA repair exonuclease SbcCD ATPase subunit